MPWLTIVGTLEELDVVEILLWFWRTLSLIWSLTFGGLGLYGATLGEDLWRLEGLLHLEVILGG